MAAFTSEITQRLTIGGKRFNFGTYASSDGGTGGELQTGMYEKVDAVILIPYGSAVTDQPVVNETFPCDNPVKIVTAANETGLFIAIGV
jgi:hypothetical protein